MFTKYLAITVVAIGSALAFYVIGEAISHAIQAYLAPVTNFLRVVA